MDGSSPDGDRGVVQASPNPGPPGERSRWPLALVILVAATSAVGALLASLPFAWFAVGWLHAKFTDDGHSVNVDGQSVNEDGIIGLLVAGLLAVLVGLIAYVAIGTALVARRRDRSTRLRDLVVLISVPLVIAWVVNAFVRA